MNASPGFQLGDVVGILRRRAVLAGSVALAIFLLAVVAAAILPNRYEAWTTLLIEPQSISAKLVAAGVGESDINSRLHLMTMQILSRGRLAKVIDDLKLYPEESERLTREEVISLMRSHIRVEPVLPEMEADERLNRRNQEIEINTFRLFYTSKDQRLSADVANRLASDFINEHIKERVQLSGDTAEFITAQLERLSSQIRQVEERIAGVKNENAGRLPEDMLSNQRMLERALDSLRGARVDQSLAESDRAFYAQQAIVAASADGFQAQEVSPQKKLELVRLNLAEYMSRGYTEKHPDVIAARAELAELDRQVAEEADKAASGEQVENFAQMNARAEMQRAELRAQAAKADVDRLATQAEEIQTRIAQTPRVAEQLAALELEYKHLSQSYQEYSAKSLEAGVAANMESGQKGEQFRVLENAFPPPKPAAPNRLVIILVGIMVGLGLGAGLAVLLEAIDSSFHGARQVQAALQVPVLASVPKLLLAADRARLRRRRTLGLVAAAGISGVVLAGAAIGYASVNGMPGFVRSLIRGDAPAAADGGARQG
jgi:polysaccharide chain length determinant protein (PEP-CTERM system associated)